MKLLSPRIEKLTGPEYFEACVLSGTTTVQILFIKTRSSPALFLFNIGPIARKLFSVCLNRDVTGSTEPG